MLVFEEMHTPYANAQEILIQKFIPIGKKGREMTNKLQIKVPLPQGS